VSDPKVPPLPAPPFIVPVSVLIDPPVPVPLMFGSVVPPCVIVDESVVVVVLVPLSEQLKIAIDMAA
jgi:hypothetical protein